MTNFSNQRFGLRWDLISAGNSNWIHIETFLSEINCKFPKKAKKKEKNRAKTSQSILELFKLELNSETERKYGWLQRDLDPGQALSIDQKCTDIDSSFQDSEVSLESYPMSLISWTCEIFCLPHLPHIHTRISSNMYMICLNHCYEVRFVVL